MVKYLIPSHGGGGLESSVQHKYRILAAVVLALGCAVRLIALASLPAGLNQDEASALLSASLITVNVNRVNFLWLPLIYFVGLGAHALADALGRFSPVLPAALALCFAAFFSGYRHTLGGDGSAAFFPGLGEAIEYADALEPESVYVSDAVSAPYIFVLLYTETPPCEFAATVDYSNPDGAFRDVEGFGSWRFGAAEDAAGELAIVHVNEIQSRETIAVFGQFAVIIPESK